MLNSPDYHDIVSTMMERDEETGAYSLKYDWSDVSPSTAIMEAVSALKGSDPVDLDPLHRTADPDAIDELLAGDNPENGPFEISFQYASIRVSARRDGTITLHSLEDETAE